MKYYPDVADYDMQTTGSLALYSAHCDLDPVLGMIEELNASVNKAISEYSRMGIEAQNEGDWKKSSELLDLQGIYAAQISPLVYESMLLIIVSRLEEAFGCWCRMLSLKDNAIPEFRTYHRENGALENAIAFLKDYAKIEGIKQDPDWAYVSVIRDARNMVVHNGSRVKEQLRSKMKQFDIGMHPEDYRLYLDYETIIKMYKAVIRFIDRVLLIESPEETEVS